MAPNSSFVLTNFHILMESTSSSDKYQKDMKLLELWNHSEAEAEQPAKESQSRTVASSGERKLKNERKIRE